MNPIGERISFVGHPARLTRCSLQQHSFPWGTSLPSARAKQLSLAHARSIRPILDSRTTILRDSCKTTISLSLKYVRLLTFGQLHEYAARATLKRGIPNGASLLDEEDNNNA